MKVQISNFQPYGLVELDVKGLTVIVGPSNVGKSALIRAVSSALFGRAGDFFVRKDQRFSSVKVTDAPTISDKRINIEWQKGQGVNKFIINDDTYDKVGTSVPIPVQFAGYKDVQIGEEYIRPQVSDQWDRVFLLDRPGSFTHDVIAQASRLSVLLKADRACASELKRQKSILKIRQADLEASSKTLEEMEPIKEFYVRVQVLKQKSESLTRLDERIEDLKEMAASRERLLPISQLKSPERVSTISLNFGATLLEVIPLALERLKYQGLPFIPAPRQLDLSTVTDFLSRIPEIKTLSTDRSSAIGKIQERDSALRSIKTEIEMVQANLDTILAEIKVCPVCERPMEHVHA